MRFVPGLAGASLAVLPLLLAQSNSQGVVWAPKKKAIPPCVAPMKPHTVLKQVLAKHNGSPNWKARRLAMNGYPEIAHLFDTPQAHEEQHIE